MCSDWPVGSELVRLGGSALNAVWFGAVGPGGTSKWNGRPCPLLGLSGGLVVFGLPTVGTDVWCLGQR
jgi:hypothetical protein